MPESTECLRIRVMMRLAVAMEALEKYRGDHSIHGLYKARPEIEMANLCLSEFFAVPASVSKEFSR